MKGLIRLSYCKRIDARTAGDWERAVFEDTYQEFYMQAQTFNPDNRYQTLAELLANVPGSDKLHYLSSRAASGYLRQLNQLVPDVVNVQGKRCLPFTQFTFELLASHVTERDEHQIMITFYSDPITWIDTVGGALLVAYGNHGEAVWSGEEVATDLISLQPNLNIWSYQATS